MSAKGATQSMSGAGVLVVGTLCLAFLISVTTACVLALRGDDIPSQLETLIGALAVGVPALLAKTYRDASHEAPQEVEVVNTPEDPVATQDVEALHLTDVPSSAVTPGMARQS